MGYERTAGSLAPGGAAVNRVTRSDRPAQPMEI
jgi:hypothetical protein